MSLEPPSLPLPQTHEQGIRAMQTWKATGREPPIEELVAAYLACWPAMHRHEYNHRKIPGGAALADALVHRRVARLLHYLKAHRDDDHLYISLDLPLRVVSDNSGPLTFYWAAFKGWHKARIFRCFTPRPEDKPWAWSAYNLRDYIDRPLLAEYEEFARCHAQQGLSRHGDTVSEFRGEVWSYPSQECESMDDSAQPRSTRPTMRDIP